MNLKEAADKLFEDSKGTPITGHTPRILYDTKKRLTNKNKPWLGYMQWNITSELKKKWWN